MGQDAERPLSFPPYLAGVLASAALGFFIVTVFAAALTGNPSSTEALALPCVAAIAALAGAVGLLLGTAIGNIWQIQRSFSLRSAGVACAISVLLGGAAGVPLTVAYGRRMIPRVILTTPQIHRLTPTSSPSQVGESMALDISRATPSTLAWNNTQATVAFRGHTLTVSTEGSGPSVVADLSGYDYVHQVSAATCPLGSRALDSLALLITLRPTSHRSILLIYGPDGQLLHHELLACHSRAPSVSCAVLPDGLNSFLVDIGHINAYAGSDTQGRQAN